MVARDGGKKKLDICLESIFRCKYLNIFLYSLDIY